MFLALELEFEFLLCGFPCTEQALSSLQRMVSRKLKPISMR